MRNYFILIFITLCFQANAQEERLSDKLRKNFEPIVWDSVRIAITDMEGDYYYPTIIGKYIKGDTTLVLEDYRMLYYGFSMQPSYAPLDDNMHYDNAIRFYSDHIESTDDLTINEIIRLTNVALLSQPFNLKLLNLMIYCYSVKEDRTNIIRYTQQLNGVLEAILSTGSGISRHDPWYVIYRNDVIDVATLLGGKLLKRLYITTDVEYFMLGERVGDIRGLYFNLGVVLRSSIGRERGHKGFEFNPLYNPKSSSYLNRKIGK